MALELAAEWIVAGLLGGLIGTAELIGRYRDAPAGAVRNRYALLYIALNVGASVTALGLAKTFNWSFALPGSSGEEAARWSRVLLSGIGAMAFFRTSLFLIRVGDKDLGVGPSSFLQVFLAAADREVDRGRAGVRAGAVSEAMKGLDCDKAFQALPPFCLALMQNVPDDVQQELRQAVEQLRIAQIEPNLKLRLLGLELINVMGLDVLRTAVSSLGDEIR